MLLSRLLGSFTRGESDTLRKAMGKKIKSKLDELRPEFLKRGSANGHDPKVLKKIWSDWEKFAEYAFNKSHATCYSWVAFQTAYLKANYPSEYMAAVLSRNLANVGQLTIYMDECKRMGLEVLGSDVNESMKVFSAIKNGNIRFGLAAVKGVGEAAAESIIGEREAHGLYKDIYDFFERVNYSVVNRKCLENLAMAGSFDSFSGFHRSKFMAPDQRDSQATFLEMLIRYGQRVQAEKNNAQQSLFGGGGTADIQRPTLPVCEDWSPLETLNKEREMMGHYLSAHPLDAYKIILENMCKTQLSDLDDMEALRGKEIAVAGQVVLVQNLMTRTGKNFGKFRLEDYNSSYEFVLFGKDYENFRPYLFENYFLMVRGKVQPRPYQKEGEPEQLEFKILSIMQLDEVRDTMIKEVILQIPIRELTPTFLAGLSHHVKEAKGKTILRMRVYDPETNVAVRLFSKRYQVELTQALADYLKENEIEYTIS